jgi:hypothetical protein
MNTLSVLCIAVGGFLIIDCVRMLVRARGAARLPADYRTPDPACMRLGERMERQAEYVRRVERQG